MCRLVGDSVDQHADRQAGVKSDRQSEPGCEMSMMSLNANMWCLQEMQDKYILTPCDYVTISTLACVKCSPHYFSVRRF